MNYLKQMWYSDPGVGKTVLAGTVVDVPELLPALMIDWEGNTDSIESSCSYIEGTNQVALANLKSLASNGEYSKDKLNVIRMKCTDRRGVQDFGGVLAFQDTLNYLLDQPNPFKAVFADSWTAFDYWGMNWVMKTFPCKRTNNDVPEYPDFRKLLMLHNDLFYALVDAPFHVFVTCQTYLEDKDHIIRPRLTGQARTSLSGIFKQVGVLTAIGGNRELRFQPYGNYMAKDCSENGTMGAVIKSPTLRKIYDLRYPK